MKAAEIIAQIKELPAEDYAEVAAFMLKAEREDTAFQTALQRKRESAAGQTKGIPYEQSRAKALQAVRPPV